VTAIAGMEDGVRGSESGPAGQDVTGRAAAAALFDGPGEVRALARTLDWGATPLGWPHTWSPALRIATRTMLDAPVPICLWSGPAYALVYNDAYRRILAAKHPAALGQPGAVVWAEIWEALAPQFAQVSAGGPPVHGENARFVMARLEGGGTEDAWFSYSLSALRDEDGAIVAVYNISPETTARVRAEQAVAAERARLFEAFQRVPSFVSVVTGPDHVIEYANEAYYAFVGRRDIVGMPVWDALPDARGQGFEALLDSVRDTGVPVVGREAPLQIVRTPGAAPEECFVDFVYQALTDDAGRTWGVMGYGTDVTAHVRARREVERLLGESERARGQAEESERRLRAQALDLEVANDELRATAVALEERTEEAERARAAADAGSRRLAFLADASARLAASLDYETTLREILALAVPMIADWALYTVDAGDGTIRLVGSRHADPEKEAFIAAIGRRYPIRADEPAGAAKVLRTGEPELIAELPDALLEAVARDPEHLELLRGVGFHSLMTVPVSVQGRVLGALGFVTGASGRSYGAEDLTLAQELARRAATALEQARLYTEAETARREAEAERARAVGILETMADAHFVLDGDLRFVSVNAATERNLSRTRDQLLGRTLTDAFPGTAGTIFERSYRRAIDERVEVHFSGEYADGALDIVPEVDAYPTPDGGVAVFWRDVAARRRAEAALVASEQQFRTLADAIPTLAWTARADGHVDWCNARWYAYTGTTAEQMAGWGWRAVQDPAALPDVMARWQASLASGEPFEMTLPLRGADGRFRRFLTRVMPVRDAGGRVVRWFGTSTDVEAERAAREAAEQAAARTALLQALTDAFSRAVTREEVADVVLDRVAPAFEAHLGVLALVTAEGDRLAVAAPERLRPDTWQQWATFPLDAPVPLAAAARDGRTVTLPTFDAIAAQAPAVAEMCRAYGTEAMHVVPVVASDGQVLGALGLSFPTPRPFDPETLALLETLARQAAQAIERTRLFEAAQAARVEAERRRAEAEGANAAKSQFLSTMSHELRTPLNAIGGYTELLTLGLRGPLTDAQRHDLDRVRLANQHLMSLVTDILNFVRVDAGHIEYRPADVELASIVGDLESLIGPQLVAKGVAFDHDACAPDAPGEPHLVRADPEKLRQVLLNLLSNAVKFTESGGRVSIACDVDAEVGVVRVRVRDTGRGIPPDQLERIFEPFVQVDRHRTHESQQGVGLGLAISRELARGMDGELTAESVVGEGSTFTLTLPLA
jgi:PAS domain S-box-containing protein